MPLSLSNAAQKASKTKSLPLLSSAKHTFEWIRKGWKPLIAYKYSNAGVDLHGENQTTVSTYCVFLDQAVFHLHSLLFCYTYNRIDHEKCLHEYTLILSELSSNPLARILITLTTYYAISTYDSFSVLHDVGIYLGLYLNKTIINICLR